jgi:hypothetical protein
MLVALAPKTNPVIFFWNNHCPGHLGSHDDARTNAPHLKHFWTEIVMKERAKALTSETSATPNIVVRRARHSEGSNHGVTRSVVNESGYGCDIPNQISLNEC